MKILFISDSFCPYGYGSQISTSIISEMLSKKGNKCIALVQAWRGSSWHYRKTKVYPFLKRTDLGSKKTLDSILHGIILPFKLISNFFITKKFIRIEQPDIINIVSTSHHTIPSILAGVFLKKPIIVDIRGGSIDCPKRTSSKLYCNGKRCNKKCLKCMYEDSPNRLIDFAFVLGNLFIFKFWNLLLKINGKRINHFIAISNFIRKQMIYDGIQKKKISVIYNPFENVNKNPNRIRENSMIFAGRLESDKGIWIAIKAFELIENKRLKFYILGGGTELNNIKEYIQKNKIKNIRLFGKVSPKKVIEFYKKSRIILGPSIVPEGFGRFIQDSIATKTPLICSRVGGIPEGIKDHKTGLLVEPNSPKALAEAVQELLTNKKIYNNIVKNLKKEAWKYSPERIGKQRLELYKQVIKENKKQK